MLLTDIDRRILEKGRVEIECFLGLAEVFLCEEEARRDARTILYSFLMHDLPGETVSVSDPSVVLAPVIFSEFHQSMTAFDQRMVVFVHLFPGRAFHKK